MPSSCRSPGLPRMGIATGALLFVLSMSCVPVQAAPPQETVGAFLLRMQEESASPFIAYCAAKVPKLKRPLELEYARFRKKFRKATAELRSRIAPQEELGKVVTPELRRQFEAMQAQDFAQSAGLDPLSFCSTLRTNLSLATEESIRRNMESAFSQYKAAVRQGL